MRPIVKLYSIVVAVFVVVAGPSAMADGRCIAYGDEETDFTWRLCPAGEKYERQYLYFGVWSNFYRVENDIGACRWSTAKSSWMCPGRIFRCNLEKCNA